MPVSEISVERAVSSLTAPAKEKSLSDYTTIIATAQGLALIEIQGDLSLPREKPIGLTAKEEELFQNVPLPEILQSIHTVDDAAKESVEVVKFGRLEIDDTLKRATLFVSTTQRLIGNVEKIDPPLGLLKIYTPAQTDPNSHTNQAQCELADVLTTKILFKQRPLPIM